MRGSPVQIGRPVVACLSTIVERGIPPESCCRQEDLVAVDVAGHEHTIHSVQRCPRPCAVFAQPGPLGLRRGAPGTAPPLAGRIVGVIVGCKVLVLYSVAVVALEGAAVIPPCYVGLPVGKGVFGNDNLI